MLDKQFDSRFVFTYPEASDITYGESYQHTVRELQLRDAKVCKSYLSNARPSLSGGVQLWLMKYRFAGDFDAIVGNLQSIKIPLSVLASVSGKTLLRYGQNNGATLSGLSPEN